MVIIASVTLDQSYNIMRGYKDYPHSDKVYPEGVHSREARVDVEVKLVVVEVDVAQNKKNLASLPLFPSYCFMPEWIGSSSSSATL